MAGRRFYRASIKTAEGHGADAIEKVYREWDRAWSNSDLDAMIALYAPNAVLESPLIPHLV